MSEDWKTIWKPDLYDLSGSQLHIVNVTRSLQTNAEIDRKRAVMTVLPVKYKYGRLSLSIAPEDTHPGLYTTKETDTTERFIHDKLAIMALNKDPRILYPGRGCVWQGVKFSNSLFQAPYDDVTAGMVIQSWEGTKPGQTPAFMAASIAFIGGSGWFERLLNFMLFKGSKRGLVISVIDLETGAFSFKPLKVDVYTPHDYSILWLPDCSFEFYVDGKKKDHIQHGMFRSTRFLSHPAHAGAWINYTRTIVKRNQAKKPSIEVAPGKKPLEKEHSISLTGFEILERVEV